MNKRVSILILSLFVLSVFMLMGGMGIKETYKDKKFKDNVVFYCQHQDDETLWASAAIIDAIKEVGVDNVYVVQVSYGTGIKLFDKEESFKKMNKMQKYECREREFLAAVNDLGVKRENIILIPRENKMGYTDFNQMERVALQFEKKLKNVTHVAHTYKFDSHLQHLKNGAVIQSLYNAKKIKDVKYFVKPEFTDLIPKNERIYYKIIDKKDRKKIDNACGEYKMIDKEKERYGIGYKLDHKSFERLMKNYESVLHTPNV